MKLRFDKNNPTHILSIFAIAFILLAIPLTVILSLQSEEKARQSVSAATIYTVEDLIADMEGTTQGTFCSGFEGWDWPHRGDGLPSSDEAPATDKLTGWGTAQWASCGVSASGIRLQLQNFRMHGWNGSSWVQYGGQIGEWCATTDLDTYSNMGSCSNSGTAANPDWAMPTGKRAIHWGTYHQNTIGGTRCMVVYYEAKSVGSTPIMFNIGADNVTPGGGIQGRQFVSRYKLINSSTWTPMAGSNCSATTLKNNPPPGFTTSISDTQAPTVTLTSPTNSQSFTSTTIPLAATATDAVGVTKVEFFVDGAKVGEDASSPYSYNWTGTNGGHTAYATAFDAANNKGTSATNSFTISTTTTDTTPPSVSLTSPTNGSTLSSTSVSLAATASDTGGAISKVEFYGDGVLRNTDTSSPYSYTWVTTTGSHAAYAKAFDSASPTPNSKVSTTVSFTVTLPPVIDSDGDSFNDSVELQIGTFPDRSCGIDAWPPDFNNDNILSSGDLLMLAFRVPSKAGDSKYSKRFDLNTDGSLDSKDQDIVSDWFVKAKYCKGAISGWIQTDIGGGLAGSSTLSGGIYTLKGSGNDIWNTADSFRALYSGRSRDQVFTARVTSQTNTNEWAKAGVMMRESTAQGAKNVFVAVTPGHGIAFQYRNSTNASAVYVNPNTSCSFPNCWLRLKRTVNTYTAYKSSNGVSWTQVGSVSFPMNNTVYDTLAVTAHDATKLSTATFDKVTKVSP
ncbi:MAG: Ig-like domain-containing protein [bacterium]|nr:Ig-like domain-containing protein [bacterium]